MFDKIPFIKTESKRKLSSKRASEEIIQNNDYNRAAVVNANFSISGSVDSFHKPPISEYAMEKLFFMQDFNIFHYNSGSFTERSYFNSFLIAYTYSGSGKLTYQNRTYTLNEGDGFFINCMDYHLYKVEGVNWDTGILHINGPLLPDFHKLFMQYGTPLFHEPVTGKFQSYLEKLLTLYNKPELNRDWQVSTCIDCMLNHLMLLSCSQAAMKTELPDNIRYLLKYMESNFEKPLTLDYLAEFANITKYYLSREFKKYTGFSPNDYLITLRIDRARLLLTSTTIPASKIAHEVGIHDMNNFTNLFKKKTGMTPTQYRNSTLLS